MSVKNLPENPDNKRLNDSLPGITQLYQSKLLSKKIEQGMFNGFGVYHNRLYLYVLSNYQEHIKNAFFGQTEIPFAEDDPNLLRVSVPLNEIGNRPYYKEIINAAKDIENILITRKTYFDNDEAQYMYDTRLFDTVYQPITVNRKSVLRIDIKKSLFQDLIAKQIDDKSGKPLFTSFIYEVAKSSDNKYLPKLYIFLSDWVSLGRKRISMADLLVILGIDTVKNPSFKRYSYLNQKVINPIKTELYALCKFFFNYDVKKYKDKDEHYYDFVIYNREELNKLDHSMDNMRRMLDNVEPQLYDDLKDFLNEHALKFYSESYNNLVGTIILECVQAFKKQDVARKDLYIRTAIEKRFIQNT